MFWDKEGKHRNPKDQDFRTREFEELYKSLPTFEYYFEHGFTLVDIAVMDRVVQVINERYPEFDLKLKNFEVTGTPHAAFTVIHKDQKKEAQQQLITQYETQIKVLEGQKEALQQQLRYTVSEMIQARMSLQPPTKEAEVLSPEKRELYRLKRKLADGIPGTPKAKQ